jgi:hypothetical protein
MLARSVQSTPASQVRRLRGGSARYARWLAALALSGAPRCVAPALVAVPLLDRISAQAVKGWDRSCTTIASPGSDYIPALDIPDTFV